MEIHSHKIFSYQNMACLNAAIPFSLFQSIEKRSNFAQTKLPQNHTTFNLN